MIARKFKFSIATNYINSEWSEEVELRFDDGTSEEEIEVQVNEVYTEWMSKKNQGGWVSIE